MSCPPARLSAMQPRTHGTGHGPPPGLQLAAVQRPAALVEPRPVIPGSERCTGWPTVGASSSRHPMINSNLPVLARRCGRVSLAAGQQPHCQRPYFLIGTATRPARSTAAASPLGAPHHQIRIQIPDLQRDLNHPALGPHLGPASVRGCPRFRSCCGSPSASASAPSGTGVRLPAGESEGGFQGRGRGEGVKGKRGP